MDIHIRHAEDNDYEAIADIFSQESVIAQTGQIPHRNATFWKNFYASKGDLFMDLVATCDEQVVGHLGIILYDNPRRKHLGTFGIAVREDFQGQGVGSTLMHELVRLSDNWLNLVRIELDVYTDNAAAVALYQKFGFEIEGTLRCVGFKNGRYCDVYKMARLNLPSSM